MKRKGAEGSTHRLSFLDTTWLETLEERLEAANIDFADVAGEYTEKLNELVERHGSFFGADLLKEAGPAALAWERTAVRGFLRRLDAVWGEALDLYRMAQFLCWEAGSTFANEVSKSAQGGPVFEALRRLFARGCLTASEVHALVSSGHPEGAEARWRTMHELTVVGWIIAKADAEVAERYLAHEIYDVYTAERVSAQLTHQSGDSGIACRLEQYFR